MLSIGVPELKSNKSISWYYQAGHKVPINTNGTWAAPVFARRILTKRLSGQRDFWAAVDPWEILVLCLLLLLNFFPAKSSRDAEKTKRETQLRGPEDTGMKSWAALYQWLMAIRQQQETSLEIRRIILGVVEKGWLFGRSLQMVIVRRKDGNSGNSAVLSKVPEDELTAVTSIRLTSHGQRTLFVA